MRPAATEKVQQSGNQIWLAPSFVLDENFLWLSASRLPHISSPASRTSSIDRDLGVHSRHLPPHPAKCRSFPWGDRHAPFIASFAVLATHSIWVDAYLGGFVQCGHSFIVPLL
jgi:hypothetical protein